MTLPYMSAVVNDKLQFAILYSYGILEEKAKEAWL